jgi:hypothetical protein
MKKNICIVLLFYICFNIYAQDPVKNYPGIPIISDMNLALDLTPPVEQFQQADSAGIHTMIMYNITPPIFDSRIKDLTDLYIVPGEDVGTHQNPILNYTDARYTVFEAEGTPVADGLVTLYSDSLGNYLDRSNGYVSTKSNTPHGTMIYGPMYRQCRNYFTTGRSMPILYQAKYILKIEDLPPQNSSPQDTVCILQVTATRTWKDSIIIHNGDTLRYQSFGGFYDTRVAKDKIIRYGDLHPGQIDTIDLDYSFPTDFPWWRPDEYVGTSITNIKSDADTGKISQNCVEFKVLWRGKADKVKLSVDKVIVSDERGRDLKNPLSFEDIKSSIEEQIDHNLAVYKDVVNYRIGAFMGVDEPWSIDQWEPIRMVNEIIEAHSPTAKLYINFNVQADGRFNPWQDPALGSQAIVIDEFMRRVKKANLWVTGWLYDMPCYEGNNLPPCDQVSDFKDFNIGIFADSIYKRILETSKQFPGLHYGLSVQSGKYKYSTEHNIREINSHDLLYQTNLVLMYGAKILFPWLYFGHYNSVNDDYTGFRNRQDDFAITDKYLTLRDTIAPRLSGLMGVTLKKLTATNQVLNAVPLTWYDYINLMIHYGDQSFGSDFDLGFFKDSLNHDYFMLINRYYNTGTLGVPLSFNSSCFGNYNNIQLYNLVDGTKQTIQNNGIIYPSIALGDALFYRVAPVIRTGGSLITNETTLPNETLYDDMSIENGATLTVNGTYNAKANITVKNGGKIVAGQNAIINFDSGKKLTVEGISEIKGTSSANKLTLNFIGIDKGIEITPGSNFTLAYCNISGSYQGIVTQTGAQSYVNISNSNITAGYVGITLAGTLQGEGFSTPPTSTIDKCNITSGSTGVSVSNYSAVLIKENTFTNCGISVLNVPSAYIQSNNISLGTNSNQSGIFVNSSGGFIRSNTIKNRVNGIHLANAILDIGGNLIENNYKHGLYIGSRSFPNLVGLIQTNPPTYYPLAGYNTIRNNGNDTRSGGENDGSEIYFSGSNAYLGTERNPGCNEISDDRIATPSMTTGWLLNGFYGNEPHFLDAIYNYWGTTIPTNIRFGIATYFSPFNGSPCSINGGGAVTKLVLKTSSGEFVDTISAAEGEPENFTTLEASYSEADNYFATGNVTQAKPLYEIIVQGNYSVEEKLQAYNKLYTIGNLNGEDENYFSNLQSTFNDIANTEIDTLIKKIYEQNAIKCDVSKEEYLTAISKFDNIIQQNPNSEEAVYAEIDIITTALNLDTTNTGLGKIAGGKYLVKGI